jgi:pimeloyl-ACP methyl ester carboxylesterase
LSVLLGLIAVLFAEPARAADWKFQVSFPEKVHSEPYTGRVYLFFGKGRTEPRIGPNWFHPQPFVGLDVEHWKPGEPLSITSQTKGLLSFPKPLGELELDGSQVQAVVRFNPYDRNVGTGVGNGYSDTADVPEPQEGQEPLRLEVEHLVPEPKFPETKWTKLLEVRSERLSNFHHRDVKQSAAVLLPASYYDAPQRRYPVLFSIPGFGGTHFDRIRTAPLYERNAQGVEFIRVYLDPSCPLGHHVFADSANNGPVGEAFIKEFLPELDRQYRTIAAPTARFLTGHSSGGWSSLWLQVTYPDHFGGVWSTAPDPVDFHDFQRIDLYRPGENMYRDAQGMPRPLARQGDQVIVWYQTFAQMEWVLGYGGQLHSFEAVFSPRGADGRPQLLWDRPSGVIDTAVAKTWEKYDIRLTLERDWKTLGPKLQGKLHVIMGDLDTFYLEGATRRLKESLAKLGSDAVVEMVPDRDHMNLLSSELVSRIRREMVAAFLKHHGQ